MRKTPIGRIATACLYQHVRLFPTEKRSCAGFNFRHIVPHHHHQCHDGRADEQANEPENLHPPRMPKSTLKKGSSTEFPMIFGRNPFTLNVLPENSGNTQLIRAVAAYFGSAALQLDSTTVSSAIQSGHSRSRKAGVPISSHRRVSKAICLYCQVPRGASQNQDMTL